jgi:2-hydroxychromene-2-carboxylate isomerase
LRAVWAQERDISDANTLIAIGNENQLDGAALYAAHESGKALYELYTREAIEQQVFGAPWYVYDGEPFWGQDRLDLLERALNKDALA